MRLKKVQSFGFTLIELLVVMAVVGTLAALILANFNLARERARDAQRKSGLNQIKKALRMYYNDHGHYPETGLNNTVKGCGSEGTDACLWDGETAWSTGEADYYYMKTLLQDPLYDDQRYQYQQGNVGQDFCLWARLENKSDGDIGKSQSRCSECTVDAYDYVICAD